MSHTLFHPYHILTYSPFCIIPHLFYPLTEALKQTIGIGDNDLTNRRRRGKTPFVFVRYELKKTKLLVKDGTVDHSTATDDTVTDADGGTDSMGVSLADVTDSSFLGHHDA